jgi:hypothetical protein
MAMFKKKVFISATALFFIGVILLVPSAHAANLNLSPATGNYAVGASFAVQVQVDSAGTAINSAGGTVQFDPTLLSVTSMDQAGSIFSLWTSDPTFSNTDGTVQFSGGLPKSYAGSAGTIITIHFKALAAGAAKLSWGSDGQVYSADGQGANVLAQSNTASYTIGGSAAPAASSSDTTAPAPKKKPAAASAPAASDSTDQSAYAAPAAPVTVMLTSPTHPDPNLWYSNNNPELDWKNTPDTQGVSVTFNKKPTSDPGKVSDGLLTSKAYTSIDDGTWYFHLRFEDQSGLWTQIANRQILIDTTPPAAFTVTFDPTTPPNTLPRLLFKTTDDGSGIDHYEAQFDDQPIVKIDPAVVQNGGAYAIPPLLPGSHKVLITAKDRAGNGTQASYLFTIEGIAMATITDIPVNVMEGEPIVVGGVANPLSTVVVTLTTGKATPPPAGSSSSTAPTSPSPTAQGSAKAGGDGKWLVYFKNGVHAGDYAVAAQMTTADGATSPFSDPIELNVTYPFIQNFGWLIIALLVGAIGYFVYLVYKEKHQLLKIHIELKNKVKDLLSRDKVIFDAFHEEIDEKISFMDPLVAERNHMEKLDPTEVAQKLKEAADITQNTINKGVNDIEDVFKG